MYGNYGATAATPTSTASTPEAYWNSLSLSQQAYLKKLVLKKSAIVLAGLALVGVAVGVTAYKKGLIKF